MKVNLKKVKAPKALKARVTIVKKSGKIKSIVFNSRNDSESLETAIEIMDELKLGSKVTIAPTHVDDLVVDPDSYVEYLFQYTPVGPGENILYKTITGATEAKAREEAVLDESWVLIASSAPDENNYRTFTGALTV